MFLRIRNKGPFSQLTACQQLGVRHTVLYASSQRHIFFTFAHHVHRARFSAPNHCNTFFVHAPKVAKRDEKHRQMDLYWHPIPPKQWNVIFMLNYLIFWPFPNDAVARNSARTHSSAMEAGARYVLFWARSIPFHSTYIFSTFQAFDVSGLVVT